MLTSWQNHSQCVISYLFDEEKVTFSVCLPPVGGVLGAAPELAQPPRAHLRAWTSQMSKDIKGTGADKWLSENSMEGMDKAEKLLCGCIETAVLITVKTFPPWPASCSANLFIYLFIFCGKESDTNKSREKSTIISMCSSTNFNNYHLQLLLFQLHSYLLLLKISVTQTNLIH